MANKLFGAGGWIEQHMAEYAKRDPVIHCLDLYVVDQSLRKAKGMRKQSLEAWAIAGIKNPQPLLDWHAKRTAKA